MILSSAENGRSQVACSTIENDRYPRKSNGRSEEEPVENKSVMPTKESARPADETAREAALEAADRLFYAKGIQGVGMDELRSASGISLKRLYRLFPSKDAIVEQVLLGRHREWTEGVSSAVARETEPRQRLLAVYDFLAGWFTQEDFRGCAFINSFGELGGTSPRIAEIVRSHKDDFQKYLSALTAEIGAPASLAPQLAILAEGAQTTAAISGSAEPARQARAAAEVLIDSALSRPAAGSD